METVKMLLGLEEKFVKVVGCMLGEANLRMLPEHESSFEEELVKLMKESGAGMRLLLLESMVSSRRFVLPAGDETMPVGSPNTVRDLCMLWLNLEKDRCMEVWKWDKQKSLNASVNAFAMANSEVVGPHYLGLGGIVDELKERVGNSLGTKYNFKSLVPFGSSVSGLCVAGSCDVDMVLTVSQPALEDGAEASTPELDHKEACCVLALVSEGLASGVTFEVKELVTKARVPVLKLRHVNSETEIDIVVNRTNGVDNTNLLIQYLALDQRVRPLITAVKYWAKCRGVCNARNATLSSYGWSLLVIHFLQHTAPAVLPVLRRMSGAASDKVECHPADWVYSHNTDSVGALLLKFFAYYSLPHAAVGTSAVEKSINIFQHVITLDGDRYRAKSAANATNERVADLLEADAAVLPTGSTGIAPALQEAPWWRVSIMDPIDSTFDVGKVVCRYEGQLLILDELCRAVRILLEGAAGSEQAENLFEALCVPNTNIPDLSVQCYTCGERDHMSADCTETCCHVCTSREHTSRNCPNVICYRCRGIHPVSQCPIATAGRSRSIIPTAVLKSADTATADVAQTTRDGDGFIEQVLSWEAWDFMNQKLFHNQLRRIPLKFECSTAWYQCFYPFLLEEMRAQIQKVAEASFFMIPRSNVTFHCKVSPDNAAVMGSIPAYMILPSGLDKVAKSKIEEACVCTVGLLVRGAEKRDLTAAALAKLEHLLVRIEFLVDTDRERTLLEQNPGSMIFNVMFPSSPAATALLFEQQARSKWELFAIGVGTYSGMRTCDALAAKEAPELVMPDVVSGAPVTSQLAPAHAAIPLRGNNPADVADEFTAALNQSQKEAINQLLEVGGPLGLTPIQLIKGPPGTGKTSTLVALLQSLSKCNLRVHAAAPTNVAVCELARRCLEAFSAARAGGASHGKRLANFLLMGNRKRLKVQKVGDGEDPLQKILFDDRVNRLQVAAGQVREYSGLLLSALRARASQLLEDPADVVSGTVPATAASTGQQESDTAYVKIIKSAAKVLEGLKVLVSEAPDGALRGLPMKAARSVLNQLAAVQGLSEAEFKLWRGFSDTATLHSTALSADEARESKRIHDLFADVNARLKNLTVVQDKLSKIEVMQAASLVFSTVNVGGRAVFGRIHFDVAVVDEATQLLQAETAIVLRRHLRCLVLAGDDKQLPATVLSQKCAELGYGESLFSRLLKLGYPYVLLNTQYRMHPAISRWPRLQFYDGDVIDGPNVLSAQYTKDWHARFPPFSVYDLTVGQEDVHEHGSKYNEAEAVLVRRIVAEIRGLKAAVTVGIISPYSAQITMLDHLATPTASEGSAVTVRVSTIDSFQGQECDIIIFSTVRSNASSNIGFLRDERRLNVAVTRAKYALVIICSSQTLERNDVWCSLFKHARREGVLFDAQTNTVIGAAAKKFAKAENRMVSLAQRDLFGDAPWKVRFTNDYKAAVAKLSAKLMRQVIKTCLGLAYGEWPKFEFVASEVPEELQEVLHVHRVLQYRLVWSVDVERSTHEQCLRMWNVVLEADVAHAVRRAVSVLHTYSAQYLQRCEEKQYHAKPSNRAATATHMPKQWAPNPDFVWLRAREESADVAKDALERSSVSTSAVLTKFFELTSDVARMFTSSDNFATIELPFVMSDKEDAIVRYNGSVFILGRSGTGKTTVILHRMFLLSKYNQLLESGAASAVSAGGSMGECKQLLVTASSILCEAIRRSYENMCKTADKLAGSSGKAAAPGLTRS